MDTLVKYLFNVILSILLFFIAYTGIHAIFAQQQMLPCQYGEPKGMLENLFKIPCVQPLPASSQSDIAQIYPAPPYQTATGFTFSPETNIVLALMGVSLVYIILSFLAYFKFAYVWVGFALASAYTYIASLMLGIQSGSYLLQFIISIAGLLIVAAFGYIFLYKGKLAKKGIFQHTPIDMDKELHINITTRNLLIIILSIIAIVMIWMFVSSLLSAPRYNYSGFTLPSSPAPSITGIMQPL